ncbi:swim zinc finger domain-containing protein [Rhypophila decipiens]|uniref:Swim zinc finger domain-containing protein n=1 Tax=Rhypophila decipiens TaxID=261697 RepID=A0AAN7B9X6_9PEZI|nr:swim zinc finger domain-containing protein [Rhypophila decipiens]
MASSYSFGIEIELIAEPRHVSGPHRHRRAVLYEDLASAIRFQGSYADADTLQERYRKHPEHYNKWWITKDGSLGNPEDPLSQFDLEHRSLEYSVSPILNTANPWEREIDSFWDAYHMVFLMPEPSNLCGSHVHVSPSPTRWFTITELQSIAFGTIYYEDLILELLPPSRRGNKYCVPNTCHARALRSLDGRGLAYVWEMIKIQTDEQSLRDFMQDPGGEEPRNPRYVLWNFDNILSSGSVEFRGGRGLRGPVRTKRWAAFVVAFVHFCLMQDFHCWPSWPQYRFTVPDMQQFWTGIRNAARDISVNDSLPSDWQAMSEMAIDGMLEGVCDAFDGSGIYSDSDLDSMNGKSDSDFTGSELDDDELDDDELDDDELDDDELDDDELDDDELDDDESDDDELGDGELEGYELGSDPCYDEQLDDESLRMMDSIMMNLITMSLGR